MNLEKRHPASSYPPKFPSILITQQFPLSTTSLVVSVSWLSRIFNAVAVFGVFPAFDNISPRLCRLSALLSHRLSAAQFKRSACRRTFLHLTHSESTRQ